MQDELAEGPNLRATVLEWIEIASLGIEVLAVFIIVVAVIYGTGRYVYQFFHVRKTPGDDYIQYKHGLGRSLLLVLEILVAADVVRTVALEPTFQSVGVLGLLIFIRTFLSWSLVVEVEGRWPWQQKQSN
jgi:uncharacterized membrane protein